MSELRNAVRRTMVDKPKLTKLAWLLVLLFVEVGGVVADGGTTGP